MLEPCGVQRFFFFNDTATTEIYTLSLHDALPICEGNTRSQTIFFHELAKQAGWRSEEHTSELQSRQYLVCRLLLEKKNDTAPPTHTPPRPPARPPLHVARASP